MTYRYLKICHSFQDSAICGFIAATNVESMYSDWSCNVTGLTFTDPCMIPNWPGVSCTDGYVGHMGVGATQLAGI